MKRKTMKLFPLCSLWLTAVLGILLTVSARATLYWEANSSLGTSVFAGLNIDEPGGTVTVTSDPLGQFGNVYQFYLPDEPSGFGKERTESSGTSTGGTEFRMSYNTGYYIGWRAMWNPMPINPGWVALMQMHGYGVSGQGAPLVLRAVNGDGNIYMQNNANGVNVDFWHMPFKANVWQGFVLHVFLSTNPAVGYTEIWANGVLQTNINGTTRWYGPTWDNADGVWQDSYNKLKWGVYRSGAMDGKGSADAYMSEARVGSTYADVDPGIGSTDFSIVSTPASQTVTAGNGTTYTATVSAQNGFNGAVNLTVSGLPSGATASFNPTSVTGSGSSTLTVSTTTSTAAGTYTLTLTGTSGSLTHSTTVSLTVNAPPPPDFSLSASPGSVTVTQGANGTSTITVSPVNGFNGSVSLSASGLPSGVTAAFNPSSTTSTSTLTLTASSTAATGTVTVTVTGTSGSLTHTTTISLTVKATPPPDFSLSASPNSVTVTQGANGTSTISVTDINGFSGSVSLSASGLPSGVTAAFNPSSTATTSTLTLTASSTAVTGTATVTVTGVSGSLTHTTTISLTVNAANSFAGIYKVQNVASGLVLNNQGSLTNGSAITQWTATTTSSNLDWTFIVTSNGYFQIRSSKSGLDAVVQGASTANGAGIIQWSFGSSGDDQWKPVLNGDGTYTFFNLHSGLVLEDPASSTNKATQMDQWSSTGGSNQKWNLLKQ